MGSAALNGTEYAPVGSVHSNQATPSRAVNRDAFGKPAVEDMPQGGVGLGGSFSNHSSPFISHAQAFPPTPLSQFAGQESRSLHSMTPISDRQMPFTQPFSQSPSFNTSHSPWHTPEAPFRRPGPFDVNHPTSNNTFVAQPAIPSQAFPRGPQANDQSPWQTPSQPIQNEPWHAPTASLTAANLGQHDEQVRQAELQQQAAKAAAPEPISEPEPVTPAVEEPQLAAPVVPATPSVPSPADVSTQKPRRKSSGQPAPLAASAPKTAPPVPAAAAAPAKPPSPVPPQPEAAKTPWAVDEDKKSKSTGPNLREIQEAEAKKAEARKAAERERERVARVSAQAAAAAVDDFQSFTASWGLPTSQAGARGSGGAAAAKEGAGAGPTPTTPAPAVWTNAAKAPVAAKKTMKEIQEEEEKRKKLAAKEKESMAAAARRAYAESTNKVRLGVRVVR